MDPKANGVLLRLTAFPGVNTNAPRGTVPAPELLENVHLDRTGGYTPMWARSKRLESVARAMTTRRADNLFVEQPGGVGHWNAQTGVMTPIPGGPYNLNNAVAVMPDLLLTPGKWVHSTQGVTVQPFPDTSLHGEAIPPEDGSNAGLGIGATYDVMVQVLPVPGAQFRGTKLYSNTGAGQTGPYRWRIYWSGGNPPLMRVFLRVSGADGNRFRFMSDNVASDGRLQYGVLIRTPTTATPFEGLSEEIHPLDDDLAFALTNDTPTTYHQGRVFLAPSSVSYTVIAGEEGPVTRTDTEPARIYFSNVIATAKPDTLPAFTLVNYVDAPFRVSRRVVALASVGPYLYIFGDRELLLMTGDPERDARIESIGDSIGAVSAASVQQLSGVVYWQSDSGVLAVQGGQVREVGEPVRDQLMALGLNVTSTVDFRRECYYLTDGATILCYHARENGWTTRMVEGGTPSLIYGGGTPYLQSGTNLYSIGGEQGQDAGYPARLPMRLRWPHYELGDWRTRKRFDGIALGLDLATAYATVTNHSAVDSQLAQTADTTQTVSPSGAGAVRLHTSRDGVAFTGVAIGIDLEVVTQDSRSILRPPLTVYGAVTGEAVWTDHAL